jgi:hypothetical protein
MYPILVVYSTMLNSNNMNNTDIQNAKYREVSVNQTRPTFNALSESKKNSMRTTVENFFSYVKLKHS